MEYPYGNDILLINPIIVADEDIDEIGPTDGPTDIGPIMIGTFQQFREHFVNIYQYWHDRHMTSYNNGEQWFDPEAPMNYEDCRDHYLMGIVRPATDDEIDIYPSIP